MLQTIEVEVDEQGQIHPLEPLPSGRSRRALLTLLDTPLSPATNRSGRGSFEAIRAVLESPEFADAPPGDADDMELAIEENRNGWDD